MTAPRTVRHGLAPAASLALMLVGCAAEPVASTPPTTPPSTTSSPPPITAEPPPSPSDQPTGPGESGEPGEPGEPRVLAADLDVPWDMAILPDGDTLITLRDEADVVHVSKEGETTVAGHIDDAAPKGEGGLLGLTLSPSFATDGLAYLYYSAQRDNRVVRYRYANGRLTSPQVILAGIPRSSNHNGGRLRFGPDGMLYIATGDVTAKPPRNAQDTRELAGKILRVTPEGKVPSDNPFGNEVWSYGHRNVQGLGWDAEGRMYASEFGSNRLDELNLIVKGGNYGWPDAEGPSDDPDFVEPLLSWATSEASPSGIAVMPDGTVLIASLRGQRLWRATWEGDRMVDEVYFDGVGRIRAVEIVGDELWLLTNNTSDRGNPGPNDDRLLAIQAP